MKLATLNDVFKFVQFRGVAPPPPQSSPNLRYYTQTDFFRTVAAQSAPLARQAAARTFLTSNQGVSDVKKLAHGAALVSALERTAARHDAKVADFRNDVRATPTIRPESPQYIEDVHVLSDTLLALELTERGSKRYRETKRAYFAYAMAASLGGGDDTPLDEAMNAEIVEFFGKVSFPWVLTLEAPPPWGRDEMIRSVGIADLMVVKQHILRYEATEIAHIENVMAKESRGRRHRFLERVEETVTLEREITDVKEHEFETSERFELNKETALTIREEQKYGFDLSVSAKYGPTLDVQSGFEFGSTESRESASKSASNYAKSITDRSLQRVEQRVREERIRKLIRETEEINRHSFKNESPDHVVGIYQFVDKVYQAQVFNYGRREMFDLFLPEPASFLWHLEKHPVDELALAEIPRPPDPLTVKPTDIAPHPPSVGSSQVFYADLVARYGAAGIGAPKDSAVVVSDSRVFPAPAENGPAQGSASDIGAPRFIDTLKLKMPEGYRPVHVHFSALAASDAPSDINIFYSLEKQTGRWIGTEDREPPHHAQIRRGSTGPIELADFSAYAAESESGMSINLLVWDASQWAVTVHVRCELTEEGLRKWQLATYDALQTAYLERRKEWENEADKIKAEVAARHPERQAPIGVPPSSRQQTILTELKKHCLSILTGYWYQNPSLLDDRGESAPGFDLQRTERYGQAVTFLEHAFEWHQIQYAFYPYYWASRTTWPERFTRTDPDYAYQQFLQAGAARVMVPVRPGFERAVNLYLEKKLIWDGRERAENVEDPTYLSIIDQLKEQSGEELEEPIPVGQPWEIRVPTSLIRLKDTAVFPSWRLRDAEMWEWEPVPEPTSATPHGKDH